MSYTDIETHELAAVVTYLEMHAAPAGQPLSSTLSLQALPRDLDRYRRLFARVGAPWLWFSRLRMGDAELSAIIADPAVDLYAVVDPAGSEVGLLELDFREAGQCELAFVGLVPALAGQGHGRWLLAEAARLAWRDGVARVHVHTCTLDHPAALAAYRRAGFIAYKRAVERFPDPRLSGLLPSGSAPQVPLLGTDTLGAPPSPAS
ncbi:GNAT family N-acetyltransferase [Sphingomonas sp.]|uniref:GNAT family N-acetyltransferase n=1 Tax=Sphingomonas sp. TaxID=28214 RepID=UPI00286D9DC8|nr:GNAT family N-acetyltransferase [Sphingomonas sp.]